MLNIYVGFNKQFHLNQSFANIQSTLFHVKNLNEGLNYKYILYKT